MILTMLAGGIYYTAHERFILTVTVSVRIRVLIELTESCSKHNNTNITKVVIMFRLP